MYSSYLPRQLWGQILTIDEFIDLQEAGGRARLLGVPMHGNPYGRPQQLAKLGPDLIGDRAIRHDAWKFGWEMEDEGLRIKISRRFRDFERSHPLQMPQHVDANCQPI
ncbi:CrpP-related protein [Rhizobium sp. NPDC090275]|uniref:CrpP-related protein n=1 Tax=Rhizobium sp. NPDC090275 TaxID=3364498 RepID=UPI00383AC1E1